MFRRLLIAVALLSLAPACGDKQNLQKINAPADGVTLAYDFTPGQVYRGHVAHSETVRGTSGGSLSRGFTFDVALSIRGPAPDGNGTLVTARYSAVDIRWGLPPGIPISVAEIVAKAKAQLQGLEVDFSVDSAGKILSMPELPEDMGPELRFLVQEALDTLETAFLSVPARPLKPGDTWKDQSKRGRPGKLGRFLDTVTTTKVEGFYRAPAAGNDEVTKLQISETETEVVTAKTGAHEVKKEKQIEALFAHAKKYLVALSEESTTFDPGVSTTFTTLKVNWSKDSTPGAVDPVIAPPTRQTQSIEDPCHPDYVGGEECQSGGATPPEPAPPAGPAGEATPNKPPAP
jgi:hypothetical protein